MSALFWLTRWYRMRHKAVDAPDRLDLGAIDPAIYTTDEFPLNGCKLEVVVTADGRAVLTVFSPKGMWLQTYNAVPPQKMLGILGKLFDRCRLSPSGNPNEGLSIRGEEILYAVSRNERGRVELTVFESGAACTVELTDELALQLAELVTDHVRSP